MATLGNSSSMTVHGTLSRCPPSRAIAAGEPPLSHARWVPGRWSSVQCPSPAALLAQLPAQPSGHSHAHPGPEHAGVENVRGVGGKYAFPLEVILFSVWALLGVQLFALFPLKPHLLSFDDWIESEEAANTKTRVMSRVEAGGCGHSWGGRRQRHGSRLKHYLSSQKTRTTENAQGQPVARPAAWCLCESPLDRNAPRIALLAALRTEQRKTKPSWPARCHRPCTTPTGQPLRPTGHACIWAPGLSRAALASPAPASKRPAATPGHRWANWGTGRVPWAPRGTCPTPGATVPTSGWYVLPAHLGQTWGQT